MARGAADPGETSYPPDATVLSWLSSVPRLMGDCSATRTSLSNVWLLSAGDAVLRDTVVCIQYLNFSLT